MQAEKFFRVLLGCLVFYAANLFAVGSEGFENQVLSGKALGMGNVFTAQADDPTAIFYNPAGLTQLSGLNLSLGASIIIPKTEYTAADGSKSKTENSAFVIPNLYASYMLNEKVSLGLGVYSNYGLGTEWKSDWPLRYLATESELSSFDINPAFAYKLNENISLGIGLDYYICTDFTMKKKIFPDGNSELSGDGAGVGGNAGVLFKFMDKHSVGLTYRSAAKADIKGDLKLSNLSGIAALMYGGSSYSAPAETEITLPPKLLVGYAWKPSEKLVIETDYQWTGWSTFDKLEVEYAGASSIEEKSWKDNSSIGIGAQYNLKEDLRVRAGYFHFETPVTHKYFAPSIPGLTRNCVTVGAGYDLGSAVIDFGYGYYLGAEREVKNGSADGKYSGTSHLIALNCNYKF